MAEKKGISTRCVHGGEDRRKYAGAITTPVVQSSTFTYESFEEAAQYALDKVAGKITHYEYARYGTPTDKALAAKLAELEGAEAGLVCATGMCAVTTAILAYVRAGGHLVVTDEAYRKTRSFVEGKLAELGVDSDIVPTGDYDALAAALKPETTAVFTETPTNPRLKIVDLERLVKIVKEKSRAVTIVDATFGTPYNLRPLELGVDLVVHSCTKYLAGHNDVLGGTVLGAADKVKSVNDLLGTLGGTLDPHASYLVLRGLKTLAVRMARHNENGQAIAEFLEGHPRIREVYYPGLKSHPQHELARRQMDGFGGVVSFEVDGDRDRTARFVNAVKLPFLGPSLGGAESLIYHPASLTFADLSPAERNELGITDNLIRLSLGLEDKEDLIADLKQALDQI